MKDNFMKHKKKIIIGIITIISYFFAPAAVTVPVLDALISDDTQEALVIDNLQDAKKVIFNDKK